MTATTEDERIRRSRQPAVLTYTFRPMFLAAGVWAIVAIAIWLAMFLGYLRLPTRFDPLAWHIHEMLFGFVMAAVAGFLLTAIPNWTGRLPVRGRPLALLASLWLLGRVACLISAYLPAWLAIAADLSFPVVLLAAAAREIVVGRNWRNLSMTAPLAVFIIADLLMHLESLDMPVPRGLGWRLGLAAPILLISVIGGRIIPSFTRNWLAKRHSARLRAGCSRSRRQHCGWSALRWPCSLGGASRFRCGGHGSGHCRYRKRVAACPLGRRRRDMDRAAVVDLWVCRLCVGSKFGTALLGLSMLAVGIPAAAAIHALTAGAIGTMILGVMPRVTLGHTGRDLSANRATVACFRPDQRRRDCPGRRILEHRRCDGPPCPVGWVLDRGVRSVRDRVRPDAVDTAIRAPRLTMSAEAAPWRCHRSLVADALSVHGGPVVEILSESTYRMHNLTPFAVVEGLRITYPPKQTDATVKAHDVSSRGK